MNIKKTPFSLLLSAVCMTPAMANYFSNPHTNTMLNVGSAPAPTPIELRAIGDSNVPFDKSAHLRAICKVRMCTGRTGNISVSFLG